MKLTELSNKDVLYRYKKSLVLLFGGKRNVLSTGPDNGGYREDLKAVFNHDANPGAGMACVMRGDTYEEHMNVVALEDLGLEPAYCSGLCTAASMENVSIKSLSYEGLVVTAIVTGGIEHNGGRVGDPATFCEKSGTFYPLTPGTINIILHMNCSLDAGTLVRSLVTVTEAKTAAIQELLAPSCSSSGIATGSGTDGTIIVSDPGSHIRLTNAGKNSKLGEMIGRTVMDAVKEALSKQSGLDPESQHDILKRIGRYGITEDRLWSFYLKKYADSLTPEELLHRAEFTDLLDGCKKDACLVTWTSLFVHLLDQLEWGLLSPEEVWSAGQKILCHLESPEVDADKEILSLEKDCVKKELKTKYMEKIISIILK